MLHKQARNTPRVGKRETSLINIVYFKRIHSYDCVAGDADSVSSQKLPLVILAEMKHHFYGSCAILEGEVQPFEREELGTYRLELPLHNRHKADVSELVMPTGRCAEIPHKTDGAFAHKLW